jgi:glutathione S-transferase
MIKIYNFAHGGRGLRIFWQCEEMGLDYEVVAIPFPYPPDYSARNPAGGVPFLEDDAAGVAISESVAIMLYLAKRYGPTPLLPDALDPALARVLQLTVFAEASLGGRMNTLMEAHFGAPEADKVNWSVRGLRNRMAHGLGYVAGVLGDRPYLAGDRFTLADIAIATTLGIWKGALGGEIPAPLVAWRARLAERPAYQRAEARAAGAA